MARTVALAMVKTMAETAKMTKSGFDKLESSEYGFGESGFGRSGFVALAGLHSVKSGFHLSVFG